MSKMNPENIKNQENQELTKTIDSSTKKDSSRKRKGKDPQKRHMESAFVNDQPSCSYSNNENFNCATEEYSNNCEETQQLCGKIKKEEKDSAQIEWPEKDLSELFLRMERGLPERDTLAFNTRVEKLDWNKIAFNAYSGDDCKKTWLLVQKKLRRFRLLGELLEDAKEWIPKNWTSFCRGGKTQRFVELPRKSLSTYMLFYLKKKDEILNENPEMEMSELSKKIALLYKEMTPEQREACTNMSAEERKEYAEKLAEFHRKYPDVSSAIEKAGYGKGSDKKPKKPLTPFGIYYEEQLRLYVGNPDSDRNAIKEKCKEEWKNMPDEKKVVWIDWSLEEQAKFHEEMKSYMLSQNSEYVPQKQLLTKEEKIIKQRVMGKPLKPPNSAYSLFSTMMLQSEMIKSVNHKSRMNVIANQWKSCSEEEKQQYREKAMQLMAQYKIDFATYLESLPEEKRREEMKNNLPKRKAKIADGEEVKRKKSLEQQKREEEKADLAAAFLSEPKQPPANAFALFRMNYTGNEPINLVWKSVSQDEKRQLEDKVLEIKHAYLKEYEKFLKSLTKRQLTAYSNYKKLGATKESDRSASDDESTCSSADGTSSECSDKE